jgi:hypothetical protein
MQLLACSDQPKGWGSLNFIPQRFTQQRSLFPMNRTGRGEERGKVRLRFVEVELEGLSSTIEEGIKSVVSAMNRTAAGPFSLQQRTNVPPQSPKVLAANGDGSLEDAVQGSLDIDIGSDDSHADESTPIRQKGPTRYTQPKFLKDLDLDGGEKPFRDYAVEHHPETDNHRYLVIASWLKLHRNLDSITIHHVYTCYQKMNWPSQKDVGQPFRQMKRKSLFENSGKGQWEITHIGLDRVKTGAANNE